MSPSDIGGLLGAFAITYLLSRLILRVFGRLGDNVLRIVVAQGITLILSVGLAGYGFSRGGPPRFDAAIAHYGLPVVVWLAVDLIALRGRRTRGPTSA